MPRRNLAACVIMTAVLGSVAARLLGADDRDVPVINVTAALPWASAETVANSVATPLERHFSMIAGVRSLTSSSRAGETSIRIQFDPGRAYDAASRDVQAAIAKAQPQLPDMTSPVSMSKGDPAEPPLLYILLASTTLPLAALDGSEVAARISMVSGVGRVLIYGEQKHAVHIRLNPEELEAQGITIDQVEDALNAMDRFATMDVKLITVAYRNGTPVRLADIASVVDGVDDEGTRAWYNGEPAVVLAVQRQPGNKEADVARDIRKRLTALREPLPAGVSIEAVENLSGTDAITGASTFADGTSFDGMMREQQRAANILSKNQDVESCVSILSGDGGQMFLRLKPRTEIIQKMRRQLAELPGMIVHLRNPRTSEHRYTLTSESFAELTQWARKIEEKMRALPDVLDIADDLASSGLQLSAKIDRRRASALGVTMARIENALAVLRGNRRISNEQPMILELEPRYQAGPQALSKLYVSGEGGEQVRLDTVVSLTATVGTRTVNHTGLSPSVTISFDLRPGANIDKALADLPLPATVKGSVAKDP